MRGRQELAVGEWLHRRAQYVHGVSSPVNNVLSPPAPRCFVPTMAHPELQSVSDVNERSLRGVAGIWMLAIAVMAPGCSRAHSRLDVASAMAQPATDSGFTLRRLADGVYAVTRNEPLGFINESNSLFIIG